MDTSKCGAARCREEAGVIDWTVPLCWRHWEAACAVPECTLNWLRKHASDAWKRTLPKENPPRRLYVAAFHGEQTLEAQANEVRVPVRRIGKGRKATRRVSG